MEFACDAGQTTVLTVNGLLTVDDADVDKPRSRSRMSHVDVSNRFIMTSVIQPQRQYRHSLY